MLKVKKSHKDAKLPTKAYSTDAGYDLYCLEDVYIDPNFEVVFMPNSESFFQWCKSTQVRTGISVAIPEGYYGRVASKSGLALKGIEVGAGVIDSGYRDEIVVVLRNFSDDDISFRAGTKIAQLIIEKIGDFEVVEVDNLDETERGKGGFGSTGSN